MKKIILKTCLLLICNILIFSAFGQQRKFIVTTFNGIQKSLSLTKIGNDTIFFKDSINQHVKFQLTIWISLNINYQKMN
jgi:hypothetical protein